MARSSGMRPGGGINSAVVKHRPLPKTAKPTAHAISPRGVSQIGASIGNHATGDPKRLKRGVESLNAGAGYQPPVGPKPSLPVGVGAGYVHHGKSGTNAVHGPTNPGQPNPGAKKPIFPGFR
jgi:hypothetical protein